MSICYVKTALNPRSYSKLQYEGREIYSTTISNCWLWNVAGAQASGINTRNEMGLESRGDRMNRECSWYGNDRSRFWFKARSSK